MSFTAEEVGGIKRWAHSQVEGALLGDSLCLKLDRSEDPLTVEEITILVDAIIEKDKEHQLTRIWLPCRDLDDLCVEQLCRLTWLKDLDVIENRLTDQSIKSIAQSLLGLTRLSISGNSQMTNLKPLQALNRLQSLIASDLPQLQMKNEDWSILIQSTALEFVSIEDSNGSKEAEQMIKSKIIEGGREPRVVTDFSNDDISDSRQDSERSEADLEEDEKRESRGSKENSTDNILNQPQDLEELKSILREKKRASEDFGIDNIGNNTQRSDNNHVTEKYNSTPFLSEQKIQTPVDIDDNKQIPEFTHFFVGFKEKDTQHPEEGVVQPNQNTDGENHRGISSLMAQENQIRT